MPYLSNPEFVTVMVIGSSSPRLRVSANNVVPSSAPITPRAPLQILAGDYPVLTPNFDAENFTQPLGLLPGAADSRMLSGEPESVDLGSSFVAESSQCFAKIPLPFAKLRPKVYERDFQVRGAVCTQEKVGA